MTVRHLPPDATRRGGRDGDRRGRLRGHRRPRVGRAARPDRRGDGRLRRARRPTASTTSRAAHPPHRRPRRAARPAAASWSSTTSSSGTCDRVLDHVQQYQLHLTQLIRIEPGGVAQMIHRDQWAFDFFPFPTGYEVQCNTIWAATDFTEANGATRVVPGSHLADDKLRLDVADTEPAEMARGSVLALRRARCTTAAAPTRPTPTASASTSPTASAGCARRRTSTSRCRAEVARDAARAAAAAARLRTRARTRSATSTTCATRSTCSWAGRAPARRSPRRSRPPADRRRPPAAPRAARARRDRAADRVVDHAPRTTSRNPATMPSAHQWLDGRDHGEHRRDRVEEDQPPPPASSRRRSPPPRPTAPTRRAPTASPRAGRRCPGRSARRPTGRTRRATSTKPNCGYIRGGATGTNWISEAHERGDREHGAPVRVLVAVGEEQPEQRDHHRRGVDDRVVAVGEARDPRVVDQPVLEVHLGRAGAASAARGTPSARWRGPRRPARPTAGPRGSRSCRGARTSASSRQNVATARCQPIVDRHHAEADDAGADGEPDRRLPLEPTHG